MIEKKNGVSRRKKSHCHWVKLHWPLLKLRYEFSNVLDRRLALDGVMTEVMETATAEAVTNHRKVVMTDVLPTSGEVRSGAETTIVSPWCHPLPALWDRAPEVATEAGLAVHAVFVAPDLFEMASCVEELLTVDICVSERLCARPEWNTWDGSRSIDNGGK